MKRKSAAFIANSLENAYQFRMMLSDYGVDVALGSTLQMGDILDGRSSFDLVIFEAIGRASGYLADAVAYAGGHGVPLLVIVESDDFEDSWLPDIEAGDFVVSGAGRAECIERVSRLLGGGNGFGSDLVVVDDMTMNMDTYQVSIAGDPVDLTYLEYALLAFFVQNPGRAFSREALLREVWGFDYFGGSRTVDVHVRRIRSKLGPGLAQHLSTIRGVGYLWTS